VSLSREVAVDALYVVSIMGVDYALPISCLTKQPELIVSI